MNKLYISQPFTPVGCSIKSNINTVLHCEIILLLSHKTYWIISCLRALCLFLAQHAEASRVRMASSAQAHPKAAYRALSPSESESSSSGGAVSTDTPPGA
jgi:hypothetical protein